MLKNPYLVLILLFISYAVCYLSKRSTGYWAFPLLSSNMAGEQKVAAADVGALTTSHETFAGISKILSGYFVDSVSPSMLLASSLLAVSVTHVGLYATTRLSLQLAFWATNGAVQAVAWPALAKVFMAWFPDARSRGKMYAVLATSQNAGAAIAPFIFTPLVAAFGWESSLIFPAFTAAAVAFAIVAGMADAPPAAGAEGAEQTSKPLQVNTARRLSVVETIVAVLTSKTLWLLGIMYFFNSLFRGAFTEVPEILLGQHGLGVSIGARAAAISSYEIGAALGGLASGYISDRIFAGRRGPVMVLFSLAAAPLPLLLLWVRGSANFSVAAVYFMTGFTSFAPHMLNGLASREFADPAVQSSAGGFTKALGQLGGAAAGIPLGWAMDTHGLPVVLCLLAVLSVVAGLSALPLWNTITWSQPVAHAKLSPVPDKVPKTASRVDVRKRGENRAKGAATT